MKLWGSVRQQAGKLAFEADKLVRIKREEGALNDVQGQITAQCTELGKAVLGLFRSGAVSHPQIAAFAEQVAQLEARAAQIQQNIAAIRAEEYVEASVPEGYAAPAAAPAYQPGSIQPMGSAGEPTPVVEKVTCPSCGAQVTAGSAFCSECGTRMSAPPAE